MQLSLLVLVVGCCFGTDQANPARAQNDLQNIEGAWRVESTHGLPNDSLREEMQRLRLTILKGKMSAVYGDKKAEATYKLAPEKDPPEIDVTLTKGPQDAKDVVDKTFHGIYQLQGNMLKIAYRNPDEKRPSSFRSEGEPGVYVVVFKRANP
jgi:uncharacterized protein (TIGR03067 family)